MILSNMWPPEIRGGAELYASGLASALRARDVDVHVVTLGVEADDVDTVVSAWPYDWRRYSQSLWRRATFHALDLYRPGVRRVIAEAIAAFAPDVVHSHVSQGFSMAALRVPRQLGIAHVHTAHDYWLLCDRSIMRTADGNCERRCTYCSFVVATRERVGGRSFAHRIVCVSDAVRREHASQPWLRDRLRVVRYPTTVNPLTDGGRRRCPRAAQAPLVLGYLGTLAVHKGVATLLEALREVRAQGHLVRLKVAGKGPLLMSVQGSPGTEYVGWLSDEDKDEFFRSIDALVVPSEWPDPSPLVVREALARGVPVIATRSGGIPEDIPPDLSHLLFDAGDARALARVIEACVRTVPSVTGFHERSWDAHLDDLTKVYAEAMSDAAAERAVTQ